MWDQDSGRTSFESKMNWKLMGARERGILSLGLWSLVDWARLSGKSHIHVQH